MNLILDGIIERSEQLRQRLQASNHPGSQSGLFSCLVCSQLEVQPFEWRVLMTTESWQANLVVDHTAPVISSLGFQLALGANDEELNKAFSESLRLLMQRNPYPESDTATFPFHPITFLGLSLGARTLNAEDPALVDWLRDVEVKRPSTPQAGLNQMLYAWIGVTLGFPAKSVEQNNALDELQAIAARSIGVQFGVLNVDDASRDDELIKWLVSSSIDELDAVSAAVIYAAISTALTRSVSALRPSLGSIGLVLRRFAPALRRWHWDDSVKWPLLSEREVQSLLFVMLTVAFADVVEEDTLPKVGHSSYRADFGIPSARVIVEVKFCRTRQKFKDIEQEIMVDATGYFAGTTAYDRMVVFIYDDSASIQEHDLATRSILSIPNVEDVVIVSRPSQLPPASEQRV